jgi:hypothetical protein
MVAEWLAIQNATISSYTIEIARDFSRPQWVRRWSAPTSACRAAVGKFSTPHDSVPLSPWDRSIVVGSRRSFEIEDFATHSIAAFEEMHSRIKLMIAAAVGRRGKWRTLWRVTTKPGQL